jgi:hypothetical protein
MCCSGLSGRRSDGLNYFVLCCVVYAHEKGSNAF